MRNRAVWAGYWAALLAITACGDAPDPALAGPLFGTWQWVETRSGPNGETRSDPDHLWRVELAPDGAVREDYEGRPAAEGTYRIEPGPGLDLTLHLSGEALVLGRDAPFEASALGDSLVLASGVAGRFVYRFVRVDE